MEGFTDDEILFTLVHSRKAQQAVEMVLAKRTKDCVPEDDAQSLLKKCCNIWHCQMIRVRKMALQHKGEPRVRCLGFNNKMRQILQDHGPQCSEENREMLRKLIAAPLADQYYFVQRCRRQSSANPPFGDDNVLRQMVAQHSPTLKYLDEFKLTPDVVSMRNERGENSLLERKESAPVVRMGQLQRMGEKAVYTVEHVEDLLRTMHQLTNGLHKRRLAYGLMTSLMLVTGRRPCELLDDSVEFRRVADPDGGDDEPLLYRYQLQYQPLKTNQSVIEKHDFQPFPVLALADSVMRGIEVLRFLRVPAPHGASVLLKDVTGDQRYKHSIDFFGCISDKRLLHYNHMRCCYGHLAYEKRTDSKFLPFNTTKIHWLLKARCHVSERLAYVYDTIVLIGDDDVIPDDPVQEIPASAFSEEEEKLGWLRTPEPMPRAERRGRKRKVKTSEELERLSQTQDAPRRPRGRPRLVRPDNPNGPGRTQEETESYLQKVRVLFESAMGPNLMAQDTGPGQAVELTTLEN